MLVMKAWLETRWRLVFGFAMLLLAMALNSPNMNAIPADALGVLVLIGLLCSVISLLLAGSGVKSQAPLGFPEGLAGSTQFTISLPVTRLRLVMVRVSIGLLELSAVMIIAGCALWGLFPVIRAATTPLDMTRLVLASVVLLTMPYIASTFFSVFLDEPLSSICAGAGMTLLLWGSFHVPPSVDIFAVWGRACPLLTHTTPWSQMAISACLAATLLFATVWCVRKREY
jgi:hypothetical protein